MSAPPPIDVITIGDELLLGLTPNGHLTWLGDQLARRGAPLRRNLVVTDDADAIEAAFRESWAGAGIVITTGGLGPTSDDRTREAVAEVLGQPLVLDPVAQAAIEERFARMQRSMTPNNLRQAWRPRDAELLPNGHGTAPGLWYEHNGRILIMLPGPPSELQPMFTHQVVPRLEARGLLATDDAYVQVRTAGLGESVLETRIEPILAGHPEVSVAYCAHQGCVDFRLSASATAHPRPTYERLLELARLCSAPLGEDVYTIGHDSLAKTVLDRLRQKEKLLGVAESCTGGLLSNCFTDLPGASKVFAGGVVCYSNDTKRHLLDVPWDMLEQHGAVSPEVAVAMATGAAERMASDYGLSITGYAGPDGGTADNPVGTVYIGLYSPEGVWCRRINHLGVRTAVKQRAVIAALDWLRRVLR